MSMITYESLGTVKVANSLGEGIVWDETASCFWWVDIIGKWLFRLEWPSRSLMAYELPLRTGSFALTNRPGTIIAAFEQGFARYDVENSRTEWIAQPDPRPGIRFNDGRVDRNGRFWAGTMVEDEKAVGGTDHGNLYRLEADGTTTVHIRGIHISNSLCWSPDGKTLYHADTPKRRISAYPYENGIVGQGRLFAMTEEDGGFPDGSTIDADGRLWNARWGGSQVAVHAPTGEILDRVNVGASQVTCMAFGGADLDILAVTTARVGLSDEQLKSEPEAGNLFLYRVNARGLIENRVTL